jgi:iron-sulfur cluster assembly protein
MFQVSEKATEMLKEYFKDRETVPSIRIYLAPGGWSGPALGMVLDEPSADDEIFKESGITYAISKELLEQVKPVSLDFVQTDRGSGYRITSNLQKSCGSCSC